MKRTLWVILAMLAGIVSIPAIPLEESLNNVPTASTLTAADQFLVIQSGIGKKASHALVTGILQPFDADLQSLANASSNAIYYRSASNTWGPVTIGSGLSFVGGTLTATATGGGGGGGTWGTITGTLSDQLDLQAALDAKQPLDADLTSLAAIGATGSWYYRSASNTWTPVAIGSGLSFSGGTLSVTTTGVWGSITGTLSSQADLQAALDAKQSLDADLTSLASAATTGNLYYRSAANVWSPVTVGSGLTFAGGTLSAADSGAAIWGAITGTLSSQTDLQSVLDAKQPLDADLTSLAAAASTNALYYRSTSNTWSTVTIGTGLTFTSGTLAVGTVAGTSVSFSDPNNTYTATNVDEAIAELHNVNGLGPNTAASKVDWSQIKGMPAGFADGTDDGASGGSGTLSIIKENGTTVGTTMTTLDFLGADFDIVESPTGEANISIGNDAITFAKMQNIVTGVLLGRSSASTGDIETITIGAGLSLSGGTLSATGSGSSVAWGSITGTLSAQSDLQTALDTKQPLDGDLTALAAIAATGNIYYRSATSTWTPVLVSGGLTFTGGTLSVGDLSATYQPLDADLLSLSGASATNSLYYRSATNTWSPVTIGTNLTFSGGTLSAATPTVTWGSITGTLSAQADLQSALDAKQTLDGDLTSLAGISATGSFYYRSASNVWSPVTVGTGLTFTGGTLSSSVTAPAWGSITGTLSSQTDLQSALDGKQPLDGDLSSLAGVSTTGSFYYRSASNTWSPVAVGSGLTFTSGTLATSGAATWGSITGTLSTQNDLQTALDSKQPLDADLTSIAGISATGSFYYRSASNTWAPVVVGSGLSFASGNLAAVTTWGSITGTLSGQTDLQTALDAKQPLDADLTSLAGISATGNIYYRSAANTWTPVTVGAGLTFSSGTLSSIVGATPGGELGGTWASPTIDDGISIAQPIFTGTGGAVGTPTGSFIASFQDNATDAYIHVINNGGVSLGGYFGMTTNDMAIENKQGGQIFFLNDQVAGGTSIIRGGFGANGFFYALYDASVGGTSAGPGSFFFVEDTDNGTNSVKITVPSALAADYVLTLPPDDGNSGQVLSTNGSGVLSWITPSSSGSGDFDALPGTSAGALDTDDVFAISVDGTESKLTTAQMEAWIESLSLSFGTLSASSMTISSFEFEGATDDAFETTLTVVDPTADRVVTLPNATTTLIGTNTTDTLSNKTLDSSNVAATATAGDNDTSIATTAFVTTAVAAGGGGGITASSTTTFTNKTIDADATGNVVKFKTYPQFINPFRVDGTGCTIGTTATAVGYNLATFSNSAAATANYAEWRILVPADWDTTVDPKIRLADLIGADTGARSYKVSMASVAASSSATAPTLINEITVAISADTGGAANDVEMSATTTLTGWGAACIPGRLLVIRIARDGSGDASTVNSTLLSAEFEYGSRKSSVVSGLSNQTAYLPFSEGTGSTTADSIGSHSGTISGATWTASGKVGNALVFDGNDDYVLLANPNTYDFGTADFTIAMWIKKAANGVNHVLMRKGPTSGWAAPGKQFFINLSDQLEFDGFGVGTPASTGVVPADGNWHHVAVTFADSTNAIVFYIDGDVAGTATLALTADGGTDTVAIGGHSTAVGASTNGTLDEVRTFSRVLSEAEIETLMTLP